MGHLSAVVVGRGVLELVDIDIQYPAVTVEHYVCKDLVYTVDRRAGVILAGTHADCVAQTEALIRLGSFNGLGLSFLRVLLGGGAFAGRAGNGVLDCVYNAVAGVSCAGNDVNVGGVGLDDGGRDLLKGIAGNLRSFAVGYYRNSSDRVAIHGDFNSYRAHESVGGSGECAAGALASGALKSVLDGVYNAVAGVGCPGDDINVRRVGLDDCSGDLLEGARGD